MKSKIDYGKIIAIGLIAVLTTAIVSTYALNTFSEEEDNDEKSAKNANSGSEDENDDEQEQENEKSGTETETEEPEIEVQGETVGDSTQAKVKIEFTSTKTDKESLLKEIIDKVHLDRDTVSKLLKVETEEEQEELKDELKVDVKIKEDKARVDFEFNFAVDSTDKDGIINAIVDKLAGLTIDDIKMKIKAHEEEEKESNGKGAEQAAQGREKLEKMAEKAKEAAKAKGKPEFAENIDNAERYLGKTDKALVALKIGLESDNVEATSFGSAQLILIKLGDKQPMFRAVIHILTDQPVDTLTACLDGKAIGQLTIIQASEELGLSIGHLKKTLTGSSITVPGVKVDIVEGTVVEGTDCEGTPMLSGSI